MDYLQELNIAYKIIGTIIGKEEARREIESNREGLPKIVKFEDLAISNINIGQTKYHNIKEIDDMELSYKPQEGSFNQRKDGRWQGRLYINGKQRTVSISVDKTKAFKKLEEIIDLKRKKSKKLFYMFPFKPKKKVKAPAEKIYTLIDWWDIWVTTFKNKLAPKSKNALDTLKNKLKKIDIDIKKINPVMLQEFINNLNGGRTRDYMYIELNACLKKAVKQKLIPDNAMEAVEPPDYESEPGRALTIEEQQKFINKIKGNRSEYAFLFYLYTGCRVGELFREKWEHVNYKKNTIFIDGTKNKYSKRLIPINKLLRKLLNILPRKGEYILDLSRQQVREDFENTRKELDFYFTLKDLRHTFSTRCRDAGIPISIYYKWLGHSTPLITEMVYTHNSEELQRKEQAESEKFKLD